MSLVVVAATGPVTLQGAPRTGHMHEGVPPGGPIVATRMIAANRAAGNRDDAPAIEVLGMLAVRAEAALEVATPDGPRTLAAGEELRVTSATWTYVAVRGGIAQPVRSFVATAIRKGDRLEAGREPRVQAAPPPPITDAPVRIVPGPDLDAFETSALAVLLAAPYTVAMPARTGARLTGGSIPRHAAYREVSRPMVRGAIEIPRDGMPIVLGPDHPTIGGYPVVAVVIAEDVERVFALPSVRFTT
jgi:allophanate hydrolase subunit 2